LAEQIQTFLVVSIHSVYSNMNPRLHSIFNYWLIL